MKLRTKQLNLNEDLAMTGGRIKLVDGTAASPSLAFSNHSNSGLYLVSAGKIGIATSGSTRLTINTASVESSLQLRLPNGTDTAPALSFSASTRTGWLYDAGKIALSLDGTRFWEVGTNGQVTQGGDLNLSSHNIINASLINGIDILAHASRHLPNGSDPLATASAVGLSLATTNATGTANAFARADHTHTITGVQASSTELTALAALSSTGLITRTAANTYLTRTITGTTNTITVSNGNGVSGNPTLTLASNPVIPGTASLTLPIGTTAQRAGTPVAGMVRYNSDLTALEYYANTAWNQVELSKTWNFTGDATGSGNGNIALTLANSGVTAGTYTNSATQHSSFTVDAKGRITSVGAATTITPAWGSITGVPADLTAIAALPANTGLLKKNGSGIWTIDTAAYITGNQNITVSGDATGSGSTAISLTLANSGVTAGTYKSVTVDSKGRVTGGTNPTTLAGYGITDALTGVSAGQGIAVSGTTSPTIAIANNPVIPGTAALTLPNGSTAQRNASPAFGESRYNTDLGQVEFYQAGGWYTPPTATARQVVFYADHFDNPYTTNWAISNIAPATQDATNSGLSIRAFDDTTEEGVGYMFTIPSGSTSMTLTFKARMSASQSTTRGVVLKLYKRAIGNNSSVTSWSSNTLSTITFANTTNFQYFSQTYTLSAIGLTAGTLYQFELTRTGTATADTLTGDFNLIEYGVTFS